MRFFAALLMSLLVSLQTNSLIAEPMNHAHWDSLLKKHVKSIDGGSATALDYSGFARDTGRFKSYQDQLSRVTQTEFDQWSKDNQLAFLINAYNAFTVALILTKYPGLDSIKDLGSFFSSPWKKKFIKLLGQTRSLDDIEHKLIRGSRRYNDPRIHFAVNCASIGCPALRAEAYMGDRIDSQLQDQTRQFLSDTSRNRSENGQLEVSSIFKWYREDFEKGWLGFDSLEDFFVAYKSELGMADEQLSDLQAGKIDIEFLDYDWRLNDVR
ncbi:MAG: DUF547 domain-containing protein [Pseudomonadales bacterium]|nr:DUF547 domain-containing protein [Pseudomonadales bacterium]